MGGTGRSSSRDLGAPTLRFGHYVPWVLREGQAQPLRATRECFSDRLSRRSLRKDPRPAAAPPVDKPVDGSVDNTALLKKFAGRALAGHLVTNYRPVVR